MPLVARVGRMKQGLVEQLGELLRENLPEQRGEPTDLPLGSLDALHELRELAAADVLGLRPGPWSKQIQGIQSVRGLRKVEAILVGLGAIRKTEKRAEFRWYSQRLAGQVLPFEHLMFHCDCSGVYVPVAMERVLEVDFGGEVMSIGSSVKLFEELELLRKKVWPQSGWRAQQQVMVALARGELRHRELTRALTIAEALGSAGRFMLKLDHVTRQSVASGLTLHLEE